jgi:hypothetical protein
MNPCMTVLATLVLLTVSASGFAQGGPAPPRRLDGRISLGSPAGQLGLWVPPNAGDERLVDLDAGNPAPANPFAIETNPLLRTPRVEGGTRFPGKLTLSQVPFQPWAAALFAHRQNNPLEPHTRCKPSGGPRPFLTPYGVEILDLPELQRVLIVDIGGPHTMRIIQTDGRPHPKDLVPGYLGHSIGRWEKDTLIVDTVGFNERFWMDRHGLPHTEKLHVTERFTRLDFNTLQYEVTIDDPGAYTAAWTTGLHLRWITGTEVFEYVCQDNNLAPGLMVGDSGTINPFSVIVP